MASLERSNLIHNMDKIAYFVAGGVGLAILAFAVSTGGEFKRLEGDFTRLAQDIDRRKLESVTVAPVTDIRASIEKQWVIPEPAVPYPEWTAERVPSLAQWVEQVGTEEAAHGPPRVKSISFRRNPEDFRINVVVEGEFGELRNADIVGVKLFRKEEDGEFEERTEFDDRESIESQAIVYADTEVEAGHQYAYKIRTVARKSAAAGEHVQLDPEDVEKDSAECALPIAIPFDYSIRPYTIQMFDAATGEPAYFTGEILVAPTEPGQEPQKVKPPANNKFELSFEFGPSVTRRGRRYPHAFEIMRIEEVEDENGQMVASVAVRDIRNRSKRELFTAISRRREVVLPETFECPEPEPPAEEPDEGEFGTVGSADGEGQPQVSSGSDTESSPPVEVEPTPESTGSQPPEGSDTEKKKKSRWD